MMINNQQALVRFRLLFCGCDLMKIGPSPRSDPSPHRTEAWCAEFDSIMSLFLSTGEGKKKGIARAAKHGVHYSIAGRPGTGRRPVRGASPVQH
jgi:hypothetical protein